MAESHHILILEDRPTDAELMQFELQEAGLSFTAKVVTTEEDYIRELLERSLFERRMFLGETSSVGGVLHSKLKSWD